jgi:hypothetical protein
MKNIDKSTDITHIEFINIYFKMTVVKMLETEKMMKKFSTEPKFIKSNQMEILE